MTVNTVIDLLSVPETATLLGVRVSAVHQRIKAGKLPVIRANGRCLLIRLQDVEKWKAERTERFCGR